MPMMNLFRSGGPERFDIAHSARVSQTTPSATQSTAHSFVDVAAELVTPRDAEFCNAIGTLVQNGTNDAIIRLFEHADCLRDIMQMECHTILIPTKDAFLNTIGPESCARLETDEGRPHLAAIFRHILFAHNIVLQTHGQSIVVDDLDRGASVEVCSIDNHATPFRCVLDEPNRLRVGDDFREAEVEMDAYHIGTNVIHITGTVLLPLAAAQFLDIEL